MKNFIKRKAEVPEDLVGDVPFTVPFHGQLLGSEGLMGNVSFKLVAFGKLQLIEGLVDFQDGIERTFLLARHISGHIDNGHQVLVPNYRCLTPRPG